MGTFANDRGSDSQMCFTCVDVSGEMSIRLITDRFLIYS